MSLNNFYEKIKSNKIFGGLILSILAIYTVIFYGIKYAIENNIIFTEKDVFLVLTIGIMFISISVMLIVLIFMVRKLSNDNKILNNKIDSICKVLNNILSKIDEINDENHESFDDIFIIFKLIQEMIINISKKNRKDD